MANDANIIKIKRSGTSGAPASLKLGELAYSYLTASGNPTSNGGDRLFIGANGVNGGTGNANDVIVIGGKYFTDMLDHERGILTASSAIITDSSSKIDRLLTTGLVFGGASGGGLDYTISTTGNNNLVLTAGTGKVSINSAYTLPNADGSANYILKTDGNGVVSFALNNTLYNNGHTAVLNTSGTFQANSFLAAQGTPDESGNAGYSFQGDGGYDTGMFSNGDGLVEFYSNNNEVANFSGSAWEFNVAVTIGDYTLPTADGMAGYVLTTDGEGTVTWAASVSTLSLKAGTHTDDSGSDASVNLLTDDIEIRGDGAAITTALSVVSGGGHSHYALEVAARYATNSLTGVATFNSDTFSVGIIGDVDVKSGGISNTQLANSSIYVGDTEISLGNSNNSVTSLNIDITGNAATATTAGYADSAGYVTSSLTLGTNLSYASSDSSYNGSAAEQINLATALTGITSISASGGTGSVTLNNGTSNLTFDASGNLVLPNYTLPASSGTAGQVLTWPATGMSGVLEWADISTSFTVTGTTGPGETLNLLTDTFNTVGSDSNLSVAVTKDGTTVTSTITLASSLTGVSIDGSAGSVANSLTFSDSGGVALNATYNGSAAKTIDYSSVGAAPKAGSSDIVTVGTLTSGSIGAGFTAIANARLANSKVTVGTTDISLGSSSTTLAGLTQIDVNNIRVTGSTISSTDTDGDIVFDPNGAGTINVSSSRITNLSDPTGAQDAATKAYVDATRTGLDVKASVRAATTANITLSNTQTIDGVALAVGNRVLVKNQDTASENGIYVVASGAWTRAEDADNSPAGEVTSGMFTFVEQGTVNADSGWVLTTDGTITLDTTSLTFVQFSGAGQITAGDGLSKTGNRLDVNVANGIEISGDNVQLASSVAGNGLTYTSGVIDIVGTSGRISVSADAIDISTSYVGQNTITTLGTVTTGTWQGSTLTYAYGGTGQTTYSKGDLLYASASNTLSKLTAGTNGQTLQLQDGLPVWADLDGGTY
jgi:hypothetical protein